MYLFIWSVHRIKSTRWYSGSIGSTNKDDIRFLTKIIFIDGVKKVNIIAAWGKATRYADFDSNEREKFIDQ